MKIPRDAVSAAEWRAIDEGVVVHRRTGDARFAVTGNGALPCLQGLVTSDLNSTPDQTRTFGALLTSKGMIVAPLWIERRSADHFLLETPARAAGLVQETFAKSLPPRLCRWEHLASGVGVGLYGARAVQQPGTLSAVVRGAKGFDGVMEAAAADQLPSDATASDALMAACRILAGIPSLGDEIDEKTLPQEVRMEELGAISYTKGCYLGQETVARLHFRGHANRRLVLLVLDAEPGDLPLEVRAGDKAVGRLTSACWSPELDAWVGQAVLRREVEDGAEGEAGGVQAVVRVDRWLREP